MATAKVYIEFKDDNSFFHRVIAKLISMIDFDHAVGFYTKRIYYRISKSGEWKRFKK
jgi:hypothetical protein